MKERENQYVICIRNRGYKASLELRKIYMTLPDKDAQDSRLIRVLDESGEDYLYDASFFVPVSVPKETQKAFPKTRPQAQRLSSPVSR